MCSSDLGVGAALVQGELVAGDVRVADGTVAEVGLAPGRAGWIAVPGFIDLQVNGFAVIDFLSASAADYATAGAALLGVGVTASQPPFITAPEPVLLEALRALPLAESRPRIVGAHVEGPFIAEERLGTHPRSYRRDPDAELLDRLLDTTRVS